MAKGRPTPFAHVADNDLAVGMFIEYLSKSPVWKESVVFILEDDAQNGPDHVDAHRSPAYIAGPYVKRNFVDHTPYTTTGLLRTIELILGLPPMSQYDAAAIPLWRSFYICSLIPAPLIICRHRLTSQKKILLSISFLKKALLLIFQKKMQVNDAEFNEVLWKGIKGINSTVPSPRRAAFVRVREDKD